MITAADRAAIRQEIVRCKKALDAIPDLEDANCIYRRNAIADLGNALAVLDQAEQQREEKCIWTEDDEGVWATACGEAWVFTEGYPWDNQARFCFACGKSIKPKRYVEPSDEEPVEGVSC